MPTGSILIADNERAYLDGHDFALVRLRDFLSGLAHKAEKREATMVEYKRIRSEPLLESPAAPERNQAQTARWCVAGAIEAAVANHDGPTLIECIIDRDDCSPELISWGRLVARANARPPSPR